MNRVFHRRSSGASAGSSISFLSEWFEHSFRASQGSAPDPAYQLADPNPSDLEAPKLADSVNSINPMLWASKQVMFHYHYHYPYSCTPVSSLSLGYPKVEPPNPCPEVEALPQSETPTPAPVSS